MTSPNYQTYQGVDITATKRFSNRWQMQAAVTLQKSRTTSRTARQRQQSDRPGSSRTGLTRSCRGSSRLRAATVPLGHHRFGESEHLRRRPSALVINGPGSVYGGVNANGAPTTISYTPWSSRTATRAASRRSSCSTPASRSLQVPWRQSASEADAGRVQPVNINTIQTYASDNLEHGWWHAAEQHRAAARLPRGTQLVF